MKNVFSSMYKYIDIQCVAFSQRRYSSGISLRGRHCLRSRCWGITLFTKFFSVADKHSSLQCCLFMTAHRHSSRREGWFRANAPLDMCRRPDKGIITYKIPSVIIYINKWKMFKKHSSAGRKRRHSLSWKDTAWPRSDWTRFVW